MITMRNIFNKAKLIAIGLYTTSNGLENTFNILDKIFMCAHQTVFGVSTISIHTDDGNNIDCDTFIVCPDDRMVLCSMLDDKTYKLSLSSDGAVTASTYDEKYNGNKMIIKLNTYEAQFIVDIPKNIMFDIKSEDSESKHNAVDIIIKFIDALLALNSKCNITKEDIGSINNKLRYIYSNVETVVCPVDKCNGHNIVKVTNLILDNIRDNISTIDISSDGTMRDGFRGEIIVDSPHNDGGISIIPDPILNIPRFLYDLKLYGSNAYHGVSNYFSNLLLPVDNPILSLYLDGDVRFRVPYEDDDNIAVDKNMDIILSIFKRYDIGLDEENVNDLRLIMEGINNNLENSPNEDGRMIMGVKVGWETKEGFSEAKIKDIYITKSGKVITNTKFAIQNKTYGDTHDSLILDTQHEVIEPIVVQINLNNCDITAKDMFYYG